MQGSCPNFLNTEVRRNVAACGAGFLIGLNGSNPVLKNCTISDNLSSQQGGALFIVQLARPSFDNIIFNNNTAQQGGGALDIGGASPSFTNCTVAHNRVTNPLYGGGGAAITDPSAAPVFMNTHFSNNTAPASGGGLLIYGHSKPKFIGCTISSNRVELEGLYHGGGGVKVTQNAAPEFFRTNITHNRAGVVFVHKLTNRPLVCRCRWRRVDCLLL